MEKAVLVKLAGKNDKNNELFAILDSIGRTIYQIWSTREFMNKNFDLEI